MAISVGDPHNLKGMGYFDLYFLATIIHSPIMQTQHLRHV